MSRSSFFCTNSVTQSGSPAVPVLSGCPGSAEVSSFFPSCPPPSSARSRASSSCFFLSKSRSQESAPQIRLRDFPCHRTQTRGGSCDCHSRSRARPQARPTRWQPSLTAIGPRGGPAGSPPQPLEPRLPPRRLTVPVGLSKMPTRPASSALYSAAMNRSWMR